MQAPSDSAREKSRGPKPLRLVVDPVKLELDDRTIVLRHTGDGGYVCLGFGAAGALLDAVDENPLLDKSIRERSAALSTGGGDPFLTRLSIALALAKEYDEGEPRDAHGRWTDDGAAGAAAASTASAIADKFSLFGNSSILPSLRALATRAFAALAATLPEGATTAAVAGTSAAAVLGTLFLPLNRGAVSSGSLPDAPDFSYRYDHDTGRLTVTRQNDDGTTETVFSGHHDTDGVFRDEDGNAIGRYLGDSVALDADAIRGYEARRKSDAQAPPAAIAQTTARTRSDPEVCPDPQPDRGGNSNKRAIAYQELVGEVVGGVVPPGLGLAIRMTKPDGSSVYLDNCVDQTHSLIEAKGFTYGDALNKWMTKGDDRPWRWMEAKMMKQAASQLQAAGDWGLEWHFADEKVANYMRGKFGEKGYPIKVFYTPPPQSLVDRFKRILERITG